MFDQIRQWLAVPVFDDEDKARVARMLNVVLLSSLAVAAVFLIAVPFIYPNPLFTASFVGATILLLIGMLWLMRRGQVRLASVGLVSVLWGIVTFWAMTAGGVQSSSFGIYTIVALVAGFLLGWRAGVIFIVISTVAGLSMVFAETSGILPEPLITDTSASIWAAQTAGSVAAIALLYLAIGGINEALARARGYAAELEGQSENLEETVKERTRDLELRAVQLATAADVGRAAASILELETLTRQVVELVRERFGLYYAGLFLLDERGQYAVLQSGTGQAGRIMKEQGHRLEVGGASMVGAACAQRQARIALDVGEEPVRFDNPLLPDTRSEMALPLMVGNRVLGALDVQSVRPGAFSKEDIAVLQLTADQVAVAIQNAQLFAEVEAALEAERRAYGEVSRESWRQISRARTSVGYRSDEHGIQPLGTTLHPMREAALRTGETVPGQDGAGSLVVPIKVREQVIGVIDAQKPDGSGEWTPEEITLLETMVDQLGIALDSARLYEDEQRSAAEDRLIGEITARMRETLDVDMVLQTAIREMGAVLDIPRVEVRMRSGAGRPHPQERPSENGRQRSEEDQVPPVPRQDEGSPPKENGHAGSD